MEICPVCKSGWRPIITRSAEQCQVCKLTVPIDCCSGVCENEQVEKAETSIRSSNSSND